MNYQRPYSPMRPIKSFQDLEVYQKLLAISVAIVKRIKSEKITTMVLDLPVKIATAHSLRFGDQIRAIEALEEVMLNCNILVVYLEQYRDIENLPAGEAGKDIEAEFFAEQIKSLLSVRMKILHLQNSWKKFAKEYAQTK